MEGELDKAESKVVMDNAADIRPSENAHNDPSLHERAPRKGGELTQHEREAILRLAADVRPGENFHPDD